MLVFPLTGRESIAVCSCWLIYATKLNESLQIHKCPCLKCTNCLMSFSESWERSRETNERPEIKGTDWSNYITTSST